ncbi:MAG: hypothetical protein PF440_11575 [Thiomicrorhabdus sp.]|jgi:hypothetical protein|nr:hypothetical protein [Thiomicrorhabdus sp.]
MAKKHLYIETTNGEVEAETLAPEPDDIEPVITGLKSGGLIETSVALNQITVNAGTGVIVDGTTDQGVPTKTPVSWGTQELAPIITADIAYVLRIYVDALGDVYATETTATSTFRKDNVFLGYAICEFGDIVTVIAEPAVVSQTGSMLYDLIGFMPDITKAQGLGIHKVTDTLSVYRDAGAFFLPNLAWHTTPKDPSIISIEADGDVDTPMAFDIVLRDGYLHDILATTILKKYDNSTHVPESITGNETVIHYLFITFNGAYLQLGQTVYPSMREAFNSAEQDYIDLVRSPISDISNKSHLGAQILVSATAIDFEDKLQAMVISHLKGETANTISPVDLLLVPQYKLNTLAAEDITMGDELSMDINGQMQKYPATGGESSTQFHTDDLDLSEMVYLASSVGVFFYKKAASNTQVFVKAGQAQPDGTVLYSAEVAITTGEATELRIAKISDTHYGCTWVSGGNVYALCGYTGPGTTTPDLPVNGSAVTVDGDGLCTSSDCVWAPTEGHLVIGYCDNGTVTNRYCTLSGTTLSLPYAAVTSGAGTKVRCCTEGDNIIMQALDGTTCQIYEEEWNVPFFSTGRYDDSASGLDAITSVTGLCGIKAQSGTILAQVQKTTTIETFMMPYASGSSIDAPTAYSPPIPGRWGELIQTISGIGYSVILNDADKIEIYEGQLTGSFEKIYTSIATYSSNNDFFTACLIGSAFAINFKPYVVDMEIMYMIDSAAVRTDHFIAVAPATVSAGQKISPDIALPLITLPRPYPSGLFYSYGPYKYQVITPTQAVVILEATVIL